MSTLREKVAEQIRSTVYESSVVAEHMHAQAADEAAGYILHTIAAELESRLQHDEEGVLEMLRGGKGPLEA